MGFEVVPAELVVKAMQDNGYKNAAYAIAELIDNSIQAKANFVELICVEKDEFTGRRRRARLQKLAVLDNGTGMDVDELRRALQFGNGGHLGDRDGIGRFGMGLPNSSMSQGSRVEVWSWQNGIASAHYSYLDLGEISRGEMREVPCPITREIPELWKTTGNQFGKSGTLVVWVRPDRCTWKTANTIVRNSEEIVGRMYRRFINDGRVAIRLAAYNESDLVTAQTDKFAKPNDPSYMMENTSTPDPWDHSPMFEPYGDPQEITIGYKGEEYKVILSFSCATKEARSGHNPGAELHGRHAARNSGVSIIRADRELELDSKWMPSYDAVARWIGIEVDFPPALDEIFGVTNNKQSATNLADLAGVDKEELAEKHGFGSYQALKEAWHEDEDIREPLLTIKDSIESNRGALFRLLKAQTKGARSKKRQFDRNSPECVATEATTKRKDDGYVGSSDADESLDKEIRQKAVEDGLCAEGVDLDVAKDLAATTIDFGYKYVFGHADSNSSAFFNVKPKSGTILITLNTNHPAYENLMALPEDVEEGLSIEDLRSRLSKTKDGLKLLLTAWARYEDELSDGSRRTAAQDTREDWGRVARQFLDRG